MLGMFLVLLAPVGKQTGEIDPVIANVSVRYQR